MRCGRLRGMTRRAFCVSFGAGMGLLSLPVLGHAALNKVLTSTGIDAVFAPFVVAAERRIFEKYGLETTYRAFHDGNVALDAVLTNSADIGATSELGGLARWDRGGKLYVTSYGVTSREQMGITARQEIKKPADLIGRTVGFPRASGGHYYFGRYVQKYQLPVDKIKIRDLPAPEMVAALERRTIDAFFLWEPWHTRALQLVPGVHILARSGDDDVYILTVYNYYSQGLVDDPPRAVAATQALIEATEYCATSQEEAAQLAARAFRIPVADMRLYMTRLTYRVEMPRDVVVTNFQDAAAFALTAGIIKHTLAWHDFLRPQFMQQAAPERAVGW